MRVSRGRADGGAVARTLPTIVHLRFGKDGRGGATVIEGFGKVYWESGLVVEAVVVEGIAVVGVADIHSWRGRGWWVSLVVELDVAQLSLLSWVFLLWLQTGLWFWVLWVLWVWLGVGAVGVAGCGSAGCGWVWLCWWELWLQTAVAAAVVTDCCNRGAAVAAVSACPRVRSSHGEHCGVRNGPASPLSAFTRARSRASSQAAFGIYSSEKASSPAAFGIRHVQARWTRRTVVCSFSMHQICIRYAPICA